MGSHSEIGGDCVGGWATITCKPLLHHLHNLQVFAGVVGGPLSSWMGSGCGPCSPLGGVVLGRHRRQWVMSHGGEASSPLVVVRAIVGVDEGCWWVLINGHVAALLLLLLRAVSIAPLSCNHCLSLLYIVLCHHWGLSSMHCVVVIHRCQNRVVSSSSVGGVGKVRVVGMGVLTNWVSYFLASYS